MGLLYGHAMHPKRSWVKFYPSPSVVTEYVWRLNNKKGDGIFLGKMREHPCSDLRFHQSVVPQL